MGVWVTGRLLVKVSGHGFRFVEVGKERKEVKKRRKSWNVVPLSLGSKGSRQGECRAGFTLQIAIKENDDGFHVKVIKCWINNYYTSSKQDTNANTSRGI